MRHKIIPNVWNVVQIPNNHWLVTKWTHKEHNTEYVRNKMTTKWQKATKGCRNHKDLKIKKMHKDYDEKAHHLQKEVQMTTENRQHYFNFLMVKMEHENIFVPRIVFFFVIIFVTFRAWLKSGILKLSRDFSVWPSDFICIDLIYLYC